MSKRTELKEWLINLNNGNKYLSDKDRLEYFYRLFKGYVKQNKVKRFIYQYLEGDGNELLDKFFNVYSSSRLCFELFSPLALDPSIDDVEFEYHLPSFKSSHDIKLKGANMDVYYKKGKDIYFIESKFTETVNNHIKDIPDAYYKELGMAYSKSGYKLKSPILYRFNNNDILAWLFPRFVEDVISMMKNLELEVIADTFDVKQEIAHLFGICQYIYKNKKNLSNTNINFYNVVYNFEEGKSLLATLFIDKAKEMVNTYIRELELNIKFDYQYKYMQEIYSNIAREQLAFGADKKVKDILYKYFCDKDLISYILNEIKELDEVTPTYLISNYNVGFDTAVQIINKWRGNRK